MCVCVFVFQGVGAVSVFKECTRMRPKDPSLLLLAAKVCINQLHWVNIQKWHLCVQRTNPFLPAHTGSLSLLSLENDSTLLKMSDIYRLKLQKCPLGKYCYFSSVSFQGSICSTYTHTHTHPAHTSAFFTGLESFRRVTLLSVSIKGMNSSIRVVGISSQMLHLCVQSSKPPSADRQRNT